ncbi:MAG: PspC domain-containing protein [Bacteroidetes bacterium]|nr:MAG: PspC domain-containing protein [Bacteroidota bacterium]
MNKILNINLGGYALTIDDDAYEYLQSYLDSIRQRFSESEGRDEIMNDIEARLGELISTNMGNRTIVMLPDVEAAVEVMGKPEDFGGEPIQEPAAGRSKKRKFRPGKRLFRDEEDAVIGGVCSGLTAYFGMKDTVWMRLIFVVLALISFGFWVPAYLLLWILVPPARTAADRLAMRGETANVENIAREIEHGVERLSKKVNEFGSNAAISSAGRNTAAAASGCLTVLGKLILGFIIFIAIMLILGLGSAWVAGILAFFTAQPYIGYFSPLSTGATYLGFINAFFIISIPIIALVLWLSRTIFSYKAPAWLGSGMVVLLVLNVISFFLLASLGATKYREGGSISKNLDLSGVYSDTLRVELAGSGDTGDYWFADGDGFAIGDDRLKFNEMVRINIRKSASGRFECVQSIRARGATSGEAVNNAEQTLYNIAVEGNILRLPSGYAIPKGEKWKVQEVRLTIGVPEGKSIMFGKVINRQVRDVDYADPSHDYSVRNSPGKAFRMTDRGLVCGDCPQFGDSDYRSGRYYEKFILEGNFETEIIDGDKFSISFEGPQNERDAVETIRSGDNLTLTTRGKTLGGSLRCIIRTPVFTSLYADHTGNVTIRGFREGRASITAKGPVTIRGFFDSRELNMTLSEQSRAELVGNGDNLEATLSDGATLEASGWRTSRADISASGASTVKAQVNDRARIKSDETSSIKIEGNARVEEKQ